MSDTQLNTSPTQGSAGDEINLLDLLQVIVENLRLLILGPLVVGLAALGITFIVTPVFTATTVFLPPQQQNGAAVMIQSLGALGGLAGAASGLKNPNDQFVAFLKSETIANALIDRFKLQERYETDFKVDARKGLDSVSKINSGKDGLITVEVDDKDPAFAAQLANAYVEELFKLQDRLALTEAQQRRVFFDKQLQQVKGKLVSAEQALKASGVNGSALKSNPEAVIRSVAEVQAKVAAQEIKIVSMRGYLNENSPGLKQAQTELAALQAQVNKIERSSSPVSSGDADYISKFRDVKYYETLFELFAKQYELAKVDEAHESSVIQIVDVAVAPERRSRPKRALTAVLATLASGILILLFVFVRQALRTAQQAPETAAKFTALKTAWNSTLHRK